MATDKNTPPRGGYLIWERAPKGTWQIRWDAYQALAIILGVIILGIYSWSMGGWRSPDFRTFAICLLIAAAALAAGLFLGFLFGIPKAAQESSSQTGTQTPADQTANTPSAVAAQTKATLKANTNLVQISDWLTKMIVGVGLYQLSKLPGKLKLLADYFAALGPPSPLVLAILGYFGIFGFLLGYLWARIYLTKEFEDADGDDTTTQQQRQPKPLPPPPPPPPPPPQQPQQQQQNA
jgi:MFS family permease